MGGVSGALLAFDLDDTLAPSKSPLPAPIAALLIRLLQRCEVGIVSGGRFAQFQTQVLAHLEAPADLLGRLHLMPTCGTQYVRSLNGSWTTVYSEDLDTADKDEIRRVLEVGARSLGLWEDRAHGQVIEDRGSQLTFSALGQAAPVALKSAWDPGGAKRSKLRDYAAARLPRFSVRSGGSTSIDVTRRGVDKAYGICALIARPGHPAADVMFVGDRLDPGGNDYPVLATGVRCVQVSGWEQTAQLMRALVELPGPFAEWPGRVHAGQSQPGPPPAFLQKEATVVSDSSDEQSGPQPAADQAAGTEGESATRFGRRMEDSEEEAERYSDVVDSDPESGNATQERTGTPAIPNMMAAFARRLDGDQDE